MIPLTQPRTTVRLAAWTVLCGSLAACVLASAGCHDGPLYGLKTINPYYSLHQWRKDEAIGVTDHQRREELQKLAKTIGTMSGEQQAMWSAHLKGIFENDPSAEMRRLTMLAAGRLRNTKTAMEVIDMGLSDPVAKVRMEACRALGRQQGDEAARMLVATLSTDADIDVRQAAITALGRHPGRIASDSLRRILEDRDPAMRLLAVGSLKTVTGRDLGTDPSVWIASLDQAPGRLPDSTDGVPNQAPDAQIASRPGSPSNTVNR